MGKPYINSFELLFCGFWYWIWKVVLNHWYVKVKYFVQFSFQLKLKEGMPVSQGKSKYTLGKNAFILNFVPENNENLPLEVGVSAKKSPVRSKISRVLRCDFDDSCPSPCGYSCLPRSRVYHQEALLGHSLCNQDLPPVPRRGPVYQVLQVLHACWFLSSPLFFRPMPSRIVGHLVWEDKHPLLSEPQMRHLHFN